MNVFTKINWDNLSQSGFLEDDHIQNHSLTYLLCNDEGSNDEGSNDEGSELNLEEDNESNEEESQDIDPADNDGNGGSCGKELEKKSGHQPLFKKYIAGIVAGLPFPKYSSLTKHEQLIFTQLHSKFVTKTLMVQPRTPLEQQKELATYIELNNRVGAERAEFYRFLKDYWAIQSCKFKKLSSEVERYISESWRHRIETCLSSYMRYYSKTKTIPLVYPGEKNDVQLIAGDVLLQLGTTALIIQPTFKTKIQTNQDAVKVSKRYPPNCKQPDVDTSNTIHKLPVSRDPNARQLALTHKADIVISSSGLKAIADNHSDYSRWWDLPVIVECCKALGRTVVYVDRPLPPRKMSVAERARRFHKLGVKTLWCHPKHHHSFRVQPQQERDGDGGSCKKRRKVVAADRQDGSKVDANLGARETATQTVDMDFSKQTFVEPAPNTNVNYRLWTLKKDKGRKEELSRHMMKLPSGAPVKDLRILVRNKLDGFVTSLHCREERLPVSVLPKLEFQSEYGAERMTRSELTNEWLTLKFREGSTLTRARVNVETSEVLLAESLTLEQITQDAYRTQGPNFVSNITSTVYCVLNGLMDLAPGQYLLTHSSAMHAFALLQKGNPEKGIVDLKQIYSLVDTKVEPPLEKEMPWTEVDTSFPMPYHTAFGRVPGTFYPLHSDQQPKPAGNKKKKSKKRKANWVSAKGKRKTGVHLDDPSPSV